MLSSSDYLSFVFSLLALLTPFAAIPVYLTITKGLPAAESARTATAAAVTAAFALITAAVLGRSILAALGTSIDSLRVGGSRLEPERQKHGHADGERSLHAFYSGGPVLGRDG